METKLFEVRDTGTFIQAFGIRVSGSDGHLARAAGYGRPLVLFGYLHKGKCTYDIYDWSGSRTMRFAHEYVNDHWDELANNAVIDVAFIVGESAEPCKSVVDEGYEY